VPSSPLVSSNDSVGFGCSVPFSTSFLFSPSLLPFLAARAVRGEATRGGGVVDEGARAQLGGFYTLRSSMARRTAMGQGRLRGDHPRGRSGFWRWRGAHVDAVAVLASCCRWPSSVLVAVVAMGHGVGARGSWCVGAEARRVQPTGGTGEAAWRARLAVGAEGISPRSMRDPVPCSLPVQAIRGSGRLGMTPRVPLVSGVGKDEDALASCGAARLCG
jgi:hypothetical protein